MSETSIKQKRPKGSRRDRQQIAAWLGAESQHDVPAAEAALAAWFDRVDRPAPAADFTSRVLAAAAAEGSVPRQPAGRRYVLIGLVVGAWTTLSLAGATLMLTSLSGSNLFAAGTIRAGSLLAAGARVARFGWELLDGMRLLAMSLLSSPDGALVVLVTVLACAGALTWLGRLLAVDASDASISPLEIA